MPLPPGADIQELIDGLEILKPYQDEANVVCHTYMVMVPEILVADVSGGDQSTLAGLNWLEHPVYACYYYPCYPEQP